MKKIKITIISSISIIALGVAVFWGYIYVNTKEWEAIVYPNTKIEDIDVSGRTLDESKRLITQKYGDAILKKNITIKTSNKDYKLNYSKLNARYNIEDIVKQAFDYGKNLNLFDKYKVIKNPTAHQYNLKFIYDPAPIKKFISTIKKEIEIGSKDASISLINDNFQIIPDKKGIKLLDDKLEKIILSNVNGNINSKDIVESAPTEKVLANITSDKLENIDAKISSFSTSYTSSDSARSTNIELSAKSINSKLLMPGETFSFNKTVGNSSTDRGYKLAPVIVGKKLELASGGGVCQVSTTLYNAILRANISSVERYKHSLHSSYIGVGMDATIAYGILDYRFKNTHSYPIYIEAITQNKNVTFNVYSNSSLNNKKYEIVNEVVGKNVKVFRTTYENSKLLSKDLLYTDSLT
ncbi:VanW family protein [Clostridium sp. FP2]|uniref:VanW family protein n=1 Tax=Clostridium sp. FP2 TaxID=2724481 RepID=UPI0013E8F6BC|nr:VanW family protein [Clostridium sp. FP2]MBZ9623370.1 VanW family protein [Clostridium sp. FP2]